MRHKSTWQQAVVLSLCLLPALAIASEWIAVAGNPSVAVYVDKQSLLRTGSKVKTWVKWVYVSPHEVKGVHPKQFYRARADLSVYSCIDRTALNIQSTTFADAEMSNVMDKFSSKDFGNEFSDVAPDSISEALLEFACRETEVGAKR